MDAMLVYFIIGLVWDSLITLDMQFVIKKKPIPVWMTSFVITILSLTVFAQVFDELNLAKIVSLAAGSATGAALTVLIDRRKRKRPSIAPRSKKKEPAQTDAGSEEVTSSTT